MKIRPHRAVLQLRNGSNTPYGVATKAKSLALLLGYPLYIEFSVIPARNA